MEKVRSHSAMLVMIIALIFGFGVSVRAAVQCPPDLDGVDTDGDTIINNDYVCYHRVAGDGFIMGADGTSLYVFGFSNADGMDTQDALMAGMLAANSPAPTLVFKQGQRAFVNLSNVGMMMRPDLFDPHSIHWHGFANAAPIFDGVPEGSVTVTMGATLTYFYVAEDPGTYMYHCHVEATEHMQMGMLGNLYVLPIQDNLPDGSDLSGFTHHTGYKYAYNDGDGSTYYDVDYALNLTSMDPLFHNADEDIQPLPMAQMVDTYPLINGRGYPDTVNPATILNVNGHASQPVNSIITANQGEKILLRISNLSVTEYFTVTALGLPMKVIGQGARQLRGPTGKDLSYYTTSVTTGGGEAYDVIIDTTYTTPGTYFLYTTNLQFLSNNTEDVGGMMTEIRIN